ncbi:MAG: hypothetical protein AB7N76_05110 [Planctomycetota bacterium]
MADEPRRRHARAAAAGDLQAQAHELRSLVRAGDLDPRRVEAAAALGLPAAQIASGIETAPGFLEHGVGLDLVARGDLGLLAWRAAERALHAHEQRRWRRPDVAIAQDEVVRQAAALLADPQDAEAAIDLEVGAHDLEDLLMSYSPAETNGPSWPLVYAAFALVFAAQGDEPDALGDVLIETVRDAARAAVAAHGALSLGGAEREEALQRSELISLLLRTTRNTNPYRSAAGATTPRPQYLERRRHVLEKGDGQTWWPPRSIN